MKMLKTNLNSIVTTFIISAVLLSILLMASCSSQYDKKEFKDKEHLLNHLNSSEFNRSHFNRFLNKSEDEMMLRKNFTNIEHHNISLEFNQDFENICKDKNQGDACTLETPKGITNGTCTNMENHLICKLEIPELQNPQR